MTLASIAENIAIGIFGFFFLLIYAMLVGCIFMALVGLCYVGYDFWRHFVPHWAAWTLGSFLWVLIAIFIVASIIAEQFGTNRG
jgi:hypothetical protein